MPTRKASYRDSLSIQYQGHTREGYRVIEGTNKLFQTIYYDSQSKADSHCYRPHEQRHMLLAAELILCELVREEIRREHA